MDPLLVIAVGALCVLVGGWLFVSFRPPGPRRAVVEWLSATAIYAALLCLFVSLVRRALAEDSTLQLWAFGFLTVFFAAGLCVGVFKTLGQLRGGSSDRPSATA